MNPDNMQDMTNSELLKSLEQTIRNVSESTNKEVRDLKQSLQEFKSVYTRELQEQKQKVANLEEKYERLEGKYVYLDRQLRRNNIVVFGLACQKSKDLKLQIAEKLSGLLQINLNISDIVSAHYFGAGRETPVRVKFATAEAKKEIFANIRRLKGAKISINDDLGPEDQRERKILVQNLKEARAKNLRARIRGNKLEVDGELFNVKQLGEFSTESNQKLNSDPSIPIAPLADKPNKEIVYPETRLPIQSGEENSGDLRLPGDLLDNYRRAATNSTEPRNHRTDSQSSSSSGRSRLNTRSQAQNQLNSQGKTNKKQA